MVQDLSTWKVRTRSETVRNPAVDPATVPLKWAHDAQTGEPRYIHDPEIAQGGCVCTCPACKLSLIPVMAAASNTLLGAFPSSSGRAEG